MEENTNFAGITSELGGTAGCTAPLAILHKTNLDFSERLYKNHRYHMECSFEYPIVLNEALFSMIVDCKFLSVLDLMSQC